MRLRLCQKLLPQFGSTATVVLELSVPFPSLDSLGGRMIIRMLFLLAPPAFQEFVWWEAFFHHVILCVVSGCILNNTMQDWSLHTIPSNSLRSLSPCPLAAWWHLQSGDLCASRRKLLQRATSTVWDPDEEKQTLVSQPPVSFPTRLSASRHLPCLAYMHCTCFDSRSASRYGRAFFL